MDIFKFVVIGSGNISRTYFNAIGNIDEAEVVGVISRSGRKTDSVGDDVEVKSRLEDITVDYDAVIITTPNGLHHSWAVTAAGLGKHVLTEKPLDITVEAMDAMISACRQNDVKLGVAYQRRTSPDNMIVKELLEQNVLGKVFAADMQIKCYRKQEYYDSSSYRGGYAIDGGGPFIQQASHNIDIYGWFFGKPVKTVSMLGTFLHKIEGEDHGIAILKHADGMIGSIEASTCTSPGFPPVLTIHSEKGTCVLENDIITFWNMDGVANPSISTGLKIHDGATSAAVADGGGHERIIIDFIEAVKQNRPPVVSGDEARLATEIVLDIYKNNVY